MVSIDESGLADNSLGRRHRGSTLDCVEINYSVTSTDKQATTRTLLNNVSCVARPGELLAIMGTSGAGKSTLLDAIAGRLESNQLMGEVRVNGEPVNRRQFRKESGYVMQSDALFPLLTVRETIRYAAYLRIQDKTIQEKNNNVEAIIKLLRLENCADTIIGDDENRGLSGGEKRRVSIAVDIVHFPPVIFLDEPTSGLDSATAQSVIESLKTLAISLNCTVILTIHQPSVRLFELIDHVLFLARGQVTYFGSTKELYSHTKKLYEHLALGEVPIANPPELFLDLTDSMSQAKRLPDVIAFYRNMHALKDAAGPSSKKHLDSEREANAVTFANSIFGEVLILMDRAWKNITRTKELFLARLVAHIFFGILVGTLWYNTTTDDEGFAYRAAYQVMTIAMFMWNSLEALPIFYDQREIFRREYSSGGYRAISFSIAIYLVQFPFLIVLTLVYVSLSYWLIGMPTLASTFFFHLFTNFTIMAAAHAFSTMLSVLMPSPMTAQTIGSAMFAVMFLFSGYFIKKDKIPDYWLWLHYLSLFKYGYDSEMVNSIKDHGSTASMSNEQLLEYYSVQDMDRGMGIGILWAWVLFFRIIFHYRLITAFSGARKA